MIKKQINLLAIAIIVLSLISIVITFEISSLCFELVGNLQVYNIKKTSVKLDKAIENIKYPTQKTKKEISLTARGVDSQNHEKVIKTPIPVLKKTSAKTYMDWKKITNVKSLQYAFIRDKMVVCEDGFLRDKHGNIGVALGSYFGDIGTTYMFVLDTGNILNLVKIEAKSDEHTIDGFYQKYDQSIIEFVVETDSELLKTHLAPNGYIWSGNFNNCPLFNGTIKEIYKTEYDTREG